MCCSILRLCIRPCGLHPSSMLSGEQDGTPLSPQPGFCSVHFDDPFAGIRIISCCVTILPAAFLINLSFIPVIQCEKKKGIVHWRDVPILCRCKSCPYSCVGFICRARDGNYSQADVEQLTECYRSIRKSLMAQRVCVLNCSVKEAHLYNFGSKFVDFSVSSSYNM